MTLEEHFKAGYELFGPEAMKIMDQFFSGEIDWETCIASVEEPVINYRIHRMMWDEIEKTHPKMIKITSKFADYLDKQTPVAWVSETDDCLTRVQSDNLRASMSRSTTPLKTNTTNLYIKGEPK